MSNIKVIDISCWIDLNIPSDHVIQINSIELQSNHKDVAVQWNDAMKSIGYCIVKGHNISNILINQLNNEMKSFFDLSTDNKLLYNHGYYGHPKGGYTPPGVESVARSNINDETSNRLPDPVENFVFCTYPENFEFKDKSIGTPIRYSQEYYLEMEKLLKTIHQLSAFALQLNDINFFNKYYFNNRDNVLNGNALRLSHYIPSLNKLDTKIYTEVDNLLYGEHTDYQGFTILYPDPNDWNDEIGSQGLQVYDNNLNQWIKNSIVKDNISQSSIHNYRDSLVINAGDLIQRWTNDYWKSPLHRVLGPKTNSIASTLSRYAIVFFTGPYENAMIETLTIDNNTNKDSKYEPILSGNHLRLKLNLSNV